VVRVTVSDAWTTIDDLDGLRALVGEPAPAAQNKTRDRLLPLDRDWLAASPFCVLATTSSAGTDASPKGDPAGRLVHVLDDTTIALAERPGNRRVDGYRNILENPRVGVLFLIPGRGDTLRINGRATIVRDAPFFDEMDVRGTRPLLAIVVEIDEIFHHCSKAFLRSDLWNAESRDPEGLVPRRAVIAQAIERPEQTLDEVDAYYEISNYSRGLY
jgi:uncharacterized protein